MTIYQAATTAAAANVKSKAGYFQMPVNSVGQPTSTEEFITMIAWRWETAFTPSTYGTVSGYVAPTTQQLQTLYDLSTDAKGDPSTINAFVFAVLVRDMVLQTATDPKWQPYIDLRAESAMGGHVNDVASYQNVLKASHGELVTNVLYDQLVSEGLLNKTLLDSLPSGGRLTVSVPASPASDPVLDKITELYIAYFSRAPENGGLKGWSDNYHTLVASGMTDKQAYISIANSFWEPASGEYASITGYSKTMSNQAFVEKVYANVLGRPDAPQNDAAGIAGWVNALDQGTIASRGDFIISLIDGAYSYIDAYPTDPISIYVDALLENRIEVGRFFGQSQYSGALEGSNAVNIGVAILKGVDATKASVDFVKAHIVAGDIQLVGVSATYDAFVV